MENDASDRHGFGHDFSRWPRLLSGDFIREKFKYTCELSQNCRNTSVFFKITEMTFIFDFFEDRKYLH